MTQPCGRLRGGRAARVIEKDGSGAGPAAVGVSLGCCIVSCNARSWRLESFRDLRPTRAVGRGRVCESAACEHCVY